MCDPWLDCGICHYCWAEVRDRKAQIRLPSASSATVTGAKATGSKRKQETVMVFCDKVCLEMYGPEVAETVCRAEGKIRRTWSDSGAKAWKLKVEPFMEMTAAMEPNIPSISSAPSTGPTIPSPHYSELIKQALTTADTKKGILELNDTDLAVFLDTTWSAFDGLVSEQESWIQYVTNTHSSSNNNQHDTLKRQSHTQAQCEALYPKLSKFLLEGNNHATIAPKTSDDDCETIRLITEILYRRQLDVRAVNSAGGVRVQERELAKAPAAEVCVLLSKEDLVPGRGNGGLCGGQRATFEDYCAMQSNEVTLVRQQIQEDLDTQDEQSSDLEQDRDQEAQDILNQPQHHQHSRQSKHDTNMRQWRKLLSILPNHLLSCFYVYLRLRDAYLLLARENATMATTPDTPLSQPSQITLSIDSTLFRTILYREVANSFGIRDISDELLGFAVFPRASFFNHSCRPNIQKKRRQVLGGRVRQMEYWSTEFIREGEECCISYGDISTGVEERRARLEDMYFFRCSCPRCLEEELTVKNVV
ncbi:hypothetical protein BGZ96_011223 [Linnemannia gamsii]|uniref:SET domain-containing protein n=1 Tax=Linnemannia gamsii TaxID=64522 RepID=A0ABQ7JT25_9FUNG|nr:hypothetical protein BGZ96_011223 [Linnemannia gamsii]